MSTPTAPRTRIRVHWREVAYTAAACTLTALGTYAAITAATPAPVVPPAVVTTVTVPDAACAEATSQLAAYSRDATATLDAIVYLYDQGVEYNASINGDNVLPLMERLAYINATYVELCDK